MRKLLSIRAASQVDEDQDDPRDDAEAGAIPTASACVRLLVSLGLAKVRSAIKALLSGVDGGQNVRGDIVGWVHSSAGHRDDDLGP